MFESKEEEKKWRKKWHDDDVIEAIGNEDWEWLVKYAWNKSAGSDEHVEHCERYDG